MVSDVPPEYQKVSAEGTVGGRVTVWLIELSPLGSVPERVPRRAENVPVRAATGDGTGWGLPVATHGLRELTVAEAPPGDAVTVSDSGAPPPAAVFQVTLARLLAIEAETPEGSPGRPGHGGVTEPKFEVGTK